MLQIKLLSPSFVLHDKPTFFFFIVTTELNVRSTCTFNFDVQIDRQIEIARSSAHNFLSIIFLSTVRLSRFGWTLYRFSPFTNMQCYVVFSSINSILPILRDLYKTRHIFKEVFVVVVVMLLITFLFHLVGELKCHHTLPLFFFTFVFLYFFSLSPHSLF